MGQLRLLVADDSPTIQKVIRLALSNEGYAIETANDGRDAVTAIQNFQPQVVLVDVALPVLNAIQLMTEARKIAPDTRFVLMTSAFENFDESQTSQFHGRLVKPFDPTVLRKMVSTALAGMETPAAPSGKEIPQSGVGMSPPPPAPPRPKAPPPMAPPPAAAPPVAPPPAAAAPPQPPQFRPPAATVPPQAPEPTVTQAPEPSAPVMQPPPFETDNQFSKPMEDNFEDIEEPPTMEFGAPVTDHAEPSLREDQSLKQMTQDTFSMAEAKSQSSAPDAGAEYQWAVDDHRNQNTQAPTKDPVPPEILEDQEYSLSDIEDALKPEPSMVDQNSIIQAEVQKQVEAQVKAAVEKLVPAVAEKLIRAEIERLLKED